jgi:hypothetical protein
VNHAAALAYLKRRCPSRRCQEMLRMLEESDYRARCQALDMALRAQQQSDTPSSIVARAATFLGFLIASTPPTPPAS